MCNFYGDLQNDKKIVILVTQYALGILLKK